MRTTEGRRRSSAALQDRRVRGSRLASDLAFRDSARHLEDTVSRFSAGKALSKMLTFQRTNRPVLESSMRQPFVPTQDCLNVAMEAVAWNGASASDTIVL